MDLPVTGVWVSDKILDESDASFADVVFQIEVKISKGDLDFYEVKEEGKPYREWCIPARLLNKGRTVQLPKELPAAANT